MELCKVCCHYFKASDGTDNDILNVVFDDKKVTVCSKFCSGLLQYFVGITHGFVLCYILQQSCKLQIQKKKRECLTTAVFVPLKKSEKKSENLTIKLEEASSESELDFNVRFQNDQDSDGIADNKLEVKDIDQVSKNPHRKSVVSVRKKGPRSRLGRKSTDLKDQEQNNVKNCPENNSTKVRHVKPKSRLLSSRQSAKQPIKIKLRTKNKCEIKKSGNKKPNHKHEAVSVKSKAEKNKQQYDAEGNPQKSLNCQYCSKTFNAKPFLQRHLNRFHAKEIEVCCDVCGRVCKNQTFLDTHTKKEHRRPASCQDAEIFHCDQCPKSFAARRGLALHKEFVHSQENPVTCHLCDLTLKNDVYLKRHMKRSHSDSVICDICGAKFKSRLGLAAHLSAHKGVKSFFCEVCGVGFVRKSSLRRHVHQHKDVDHNCDTCPSSYKSLGSCSLHMLQLHQRGPYFLNRLKSAEKLGFVVDQEAVQRHSDRQCVACGDDLAIGEACPKHPTQHAISFRCHRCDLTAEHVEDLLAHLRDHSAGAHSSDVSVSFGCKVCHKSFPRKFSLDQHLRKNHPGSSMADLVLSTTTSKNYVCQVCGKPFGQKQYLHVHMKQHLRPRTFACSLCPRSFTYKCNLKHHLTTHSQHKPYACDICAKPFRRKEVMQSHRLVHDPSQSPFKCGVCGKGLSRRHYLKKHYEVMHPDATFQEVPGPASSLLPGKEAENLKEGSSDQTEEPSSKSRLQGQETENHKKNSSAQRLKKVPKSEKSPYQWQETLNLPETRAGQHQEVPMPRLEMDLSQEPPQECRDVPKDQAGSLANLQLWS